MKAAIFAREGVIEVTERPAPEIKCEDDAIIRISVCGICGSDVRALNVPPLMHDKPGVIMGHEFVGDVVEAGRAANHLVGRRVVAVPNVHCGRCYYCKSTEVHHCDNFEHIGATTDGAFAEYCVVPASLLHAVPDNLTDEVAALAEPLSCVLNATNRADWRPAAAAVVMGGGPIGMLFLIVAKLAGVSPLLVSEPNAGRAGLALQVGADMAIDPTSEGLVGAVKRATDAMGAHVVVDAVGTLLDTGLACLRKGGQLIIFGLDEAAVTSTKPSLIANRELRIEGSYITNGTFPTALKLLSDHQDLFAPLITSTLALEEVATGVRRMRSGEDVKVLVRP